jgi:hypothetical protein
MDLSHFLLILATFLLTFGITIESILSRYEQPTLKVLKNVINVAYWPIYGQVVLLEKLEKCHENIDDCENFKEVNVIYALLLIYMIIACILLVNLLIAMFRYIVYRPNNPTEATRNLHLFPAPATIASKQRQMSFGKTKDMA